MRAVLRGAWVLCAVLAAGPAVADPTARVVAVGDIALVDAVLRRAREGVDPFAAVRPLLAAADLAMGNLECVLSSRPAPAARVGAPPRVTLAAPCAGASLLTAAGFDLLSLANNHAFDLGPAGALDSLRCVRGAGLAAVGLGGSRAEAEAPVRVTLGGLRVGVVAFAYDTNRPAGAGARVALLDDDPVAAVRALRPTVDAVLVSLHWGVEFVHTPTAAQVRLAHALVDAGADAVIGHHPHVLQGVEVYRGRPVVYSLGNFVFGPQRWPRDASAVLGLTLTRARAGEGAVRAVTLTPVRAVGRRGVLTLATGLSGDAVRALVRRSSARFATRMRTTAGALAVELEARR
jgi:poly-gamma-glutamate capsule biosynthesis protein CapA/YwtB (metallophosphatase superfamily)